MRIINSIKARLDSLKNTKNSRYWEYTEFYSDGILWEAAVFFESFGGSNFQGNPYYIYREMLLNKEYQSLRAVVAHRSPDTLKDELIKRGVYDETRVNIVQTGTRAYREALTHCKYLVNNVGFSSDFIKKEGQVYLNTWHGTPLKTLGRRIHGDAFACINGQRNFLMADYLLAPNELTKRVYEQDYMVEGKMSGDCYLGGYPRNSVFFDGASRAAVKERYGLNNVTSILYMPTWRGSACGVSKVDQISDVERLAKELGEGYKVFVKFHPAMMGASTQFEYCYPMPDDVEVYEFLNGTDILLTDYSSVYFDFANTKQRIILYQYDKEEYFRDRGVYREAEENLPFDIAYRYDDLLSLIRNGKKEIYPEFLQRFCKYDNLLGAKQALDRLMHGKRVGNADTVDLYVINWNISEEELLALNERLHGCNYLFVFVLGKSGCYDNVSCWDQIDYTSLNTYDRLSPKERRRARWYKLCYALFRSKKALSQLRKLAQRERKRLWGALNIGHIYSKNKRVPFAVKYDLEAWPSELK